MPQDCTMGIKPNQGLIKLYSNEGYAHMIVMGFADKDTRAAAKVLANYKDYGLKGTEYIVENK